MVKANMGTEKIKEPGSRADYLIRRYDRFKGERGNFESYWQSLHDYFYIEAADVSAVSSPGSELKSAYLYDSTTLSAADVLASGFMNYLTPPTSKWSRLVHKDYKMREDKKISDFLEDVTDEVHYVLNRSNFYDQMFPTYKSSGVYGTSIVLVEEDLEDGVRLYSIPLKQCVIIEDGNGRVREYFIEFEYTAEQAATRWGIEKLHPKLKQELTKEKETNKKHLFLLYIAPRNRREVQKENKENMPFEATWIDHENKTIIDEGGYNESPAMTHRFDKRPFIPWGYSPGMKALPFARMLNAIAKTNLRALMKRTDPPIALPDNAFIMPFNQNPKGINYYNKAKMEGKDIFAFGNYGDPQAGALALEYYANQVKEIMFNDVFLAFNQITKQMNNPEVYERIAEKMTLLGPSVGRYISELLHPIIIRVVGILARQGRLPEAPRGFDIDYEIDTVSQLAQAQKRSELNALTSGLSLAGQIAQFDPSVLDNISPDRTVKEAWSIIGAPTQVLRSDDEVSAIREARAEVAAQQQEMNMIQQGAEVVEKGSKVDMNLSKASQQKGK